MKYLRIGIGMAFLGGLFALQGCGYLEHSWHAARGSFPFKHCYRPSYETVGAMYKTDPGLAIEFLERMSRKDPDNLAYRLTLADMYKDAGQANDAIRLWFEILEVAGRHPRGMGRGLKVYFIPLAPDRKEGIRPYPHNIDKVLVYDEIARIYLQNGFYEEAADYFSRAAERSGDPDRKAALYEQAGLAMGAKADEVPAGGKESGSETGVPDPMQYRSKEMAFYLMALSLEIRDPALRGRIGERLTVLQQKIASGGDHPTPAAEQPMVPEGSPGPGPGESPPSKAAAEPRT